VLCFIGASSWNGPHACCRDRGLGAARTIRWCDPLQAERRVK
jgi:hypothetical protein